MTQKTEKSLEESLKEAYVKPKKIAGNLFKFHNHNNASNPPKHSTLFQ